MKKVIVAPQAEQDLVDISDYIGDDNHIRATSFVREIFERFRIVAERPKSFPARDDLESGLRSSLYGNYVIFFVEYDDHVRIVRVTHGSRDFFRLNFGDQQ